MAPEELILNYAFWFFVGGGLTVYDFFGAIKDE
jgi:hypothetical protein